MTRNPVVQEWIINRLYAAVNTAHPVEHFNMMRYWVHDRLLVGGSIQGTEDLEHLARDVGITHVVSVESERPDPPIGASGVFGIWRPFEDNGHPVSAEIMGDIVGFVSGVLVAEPNANFYVHCQGGGSRSPAIAYGIMRGVFGMTRDEAIAAVRVAKPDWGGGTHVPNYIDSIDKALACASS